MQHLLICLFMFISCCSVLGQESGGKVNGISIWSDVTPRESDDYNFIKRTNANWISLQPYGVITTDSTGVEFNREDIWECSSYKGLIKSIQIAHDKGYYVFLKPHLIVKYNKPGAWVGDLKLNTERKWEIYEQSYKEYLISLAKIADSMHVAMFSLGTELGNYPITRTKNWNEIIDTVRSIYKGALTYCANFDAYESFPFWDKMDLIGIDAYFTIGRSKNAELDECRAGWKPIAKKLEAYSNTFGKKILFAEYGYMSTDYCALKPFGGNGSTRVNLVAQANAYRAIFDTFWNEKWFAGGFSWFWRFDNDQPENYDNTDFSPQNKPAEQIISKNYRLFK